MLLFIYMLILFLLSWTAAVETSASKDKFSGLLRRGMLLSKISWNRRKNLRIEKSLKGIFAFEEMIHETQMTENKNYKSISFVFSR